MPENYSEEVLYKTIREGLAAPVEREDRSGRTELEILADHLSHQGVEHERHAFVNVAERLIEEIPSLSDSETARLVKFLILGEAPQTLARRVSRTLQKLESRDTASKRGDVMWLLYRLGQRFVPKQIRDEAYVREVRPWLWFDLAIETDPVVAAEALPELRGQPNFFRVMLSRIVQIWRKIDPARFEDFVAAICENLNAAERVEFKRYLKGFDIRLFDSEAHDADPRFEELAARVSQSVYPSVGLELAET